MSGDPNVLVAPFGGRWVQRASDNTVFFIGNRDVYDKAMKEGFVHTDPPEVTAARAAAAREALKAELRAELEAEGKAAAADAGAEPAPMPLHANQEAAYIAEVHERNTAARKAFGDIGKK